MSDDNDGEQELPPDIERRVHVPRAVVWAVAALLTFAFVSIYFLGLAQSTWDIGNESHVDLSRCLPVLRAALATTDTPPEALQRLADAAQPGIWKSEAYAALREAQQLLAPLSGNPAVAAVVDKLRVMLPSDQYGYLSCGYRQPGREQTSPTLRSIP